MKERPILFSAPMVRAILAGTKTQTRRVAPIRGLNVVQHPGGVLTWSVSFMKAVKGVLGSHSGGKFSDLQARSIIASQFNPYGQPGDRLWVRENGWQRPFRSARDMREGADTWPPYEYDAEPVCCWEDGELKRLGWKRRPSIHMPRWASRILLEVTAVRVERLQDISEADAWAEGIDAAEALSMGCSDGAAAAYSALWERINGTGSWAANPFVWVVEFRRVEA